jgi:hypothetical protein
MRHYAQKPQVRREQVAELRHALQGVAGAEQLLTDADALVEKSIWLIGGDGWAYDIGFGGLDHVLSLTENVNILVWIRSVIPIPAVRHQRLRRWAPSQNLVNTENVRRAKISV